MDEGALNADGQIPMRNDENAANATNAAPNIEQTADILKLDIDCFDEAFDYLPLLDLISVGRTCKRLEKVAGYCFHQNYPYAQIVIHSEGLQVVRYDISINVVTHFAPFIRSITITECGDLEFLITNKSKFRWLKHIEIRHLNVTEAETDCLKEILSRVEVLHIDDCKLNFHAIHTLCPKLRHLKIDNCCTDYTWLHQNYPALEYFEFYSDKEENGTIDDILKFFELNVNVRKFSITAQYLWANREQIKRTECIKLDELCISIAWDSDIEIGALCELLNELHQREIFKRLFLSITQRFNQDMVDELATLNGFVKLNTHSMEDGIALNSLRSLEELSITIYHPIMDIESVANDFVNLKRINLFSAGLVDISPFIRRSVALKAIRVDSLRHDTQFSPVTNIIDLPALNIERQQLPDAEKITLYVDEQIYLATKWAFKEIDLDKIRLKRLEAFRPDLEFI